MKYLLLTLLFAAAIPAHAAMPVEIVTTANDPVGSQLVYAIKEKIRQSSSLELSLDSSVLRMQAQIVTLDQYPQSPGISTVYSVVLTWNNPEQPLPFYLTQYTGYCGSQAVDSCADTVVAKISDQSDQILRMLITMSKK